MKWTVHLAVPTAVLDQDHNLVVQARTPGEARLIASAPTMLAALVEIVADIEAYCSDDRINDLCDAWRNESYDHDSDRPTDLTVVLATLQAAIAKATGKEVVP